MSEVRPSVDGSGLEITGLFATWDEDSEREAFLPTAFGKSLPEALSHGIPVLYQHNKQEVPYGYVKSAEVTSKGLFGAIVLPKPEAGTKARTIYNAVKEGLIDKFSLGGIWKRERIGGKTRLICERILEVSLAPLAINVHAKVSGVTAVEGVKSFCDISPLNAAVDLSVKRQLADRRDRELEALELGLTVATMRLRALAAPRPRILAGTPII